MWFRPELAQVVDKIPGEAVVIVDDKEQGGLPASTGDELGRADRVGQGRHVCPDRSSGLADCDGPEKIG
jgi:hypothetical protein